MHYPDGGGDLMRCMNRNKTTVHYCLYEKDVPLRDRNGNLTGEKYSGYAEAVPLRCNVSPATGNAQAEQFGNLDSYDKVIVVDDVSCPIDENTVLFVDKPVEYAEDGPVYDYRVKRVARSKNTISYAICKVKVS